MQTPPTRQDFGIVGDLDVDWAWKNFGGKSLDDAYLLFISNPDCFQEDLVWMDTPAFLFYFPVAIRYLMSEDAKGDRSAVSAIASVLKSRFKNDGTEPTRSLFEQIKTLCDYVVLNYDKFKINDIWGDVKGQYQEIKRQIEFGSAANSSHQRLMIIGFIGAGVMARALGKGLVHGGIVPANDLICSAPASRDGQPFLDLLPGARWTARNDEVVRESDLTILAVKPQVLPEAMSTLSEISAGKLFLSIAAGVTLEKIGGWLHPTARVVRAMPNTPMQVGEGASVYAGGPNVTEADLALVHRILSAAGKAWRVEEKQIDTITALSGSGPAYVFHFMDALIRGAVALGLPEPLARELTLQTVLGSAQLAAPSPLSPLELATQVKSPKGTTLAGCAVLEEHDALNQLMARCLAAAKNRAEELARGEN